MRLLLLSFLILSSLLFGIFDANGIAYFPPPLKQILHVVSSENVTCTEGLVLVIKIANNLPACIHVTSKEILIQRGWAMDFVVSLLDSQNFHLSNVNDEYKIVEKAKAILNHVLEKEQFQSLGKYIEGQTDDGYEIVFYNVS